jgi:hypothetical protein
MTKKIPIKNSDIYFAEMKTWEAVVDLPYLTLQDYERLFLENNAASLLFHEEQGHVVVRQDDGWQSQDDNEWTWVEEYRMPLPLPAFVLRFVFGPNASQQGPLMQSRRNVVRL